MSAQISVTTCPICGGKLRVSETRVVMHGLRRRRRCLNRACDGRLSTIEIIVPSDRKSRGVLALVPLDDLELIHSLVASHLEARHAALEDDEAPDAETASPAATTSELDH